eukprot:scaffold114974_cov48-Phaeocystis_antarctica.AAC.1
MRSEAGHHAVCEPLARRAARARTAAACACLATHAAVSLPPAAIAPPWPHVRCAAAAPLLHRASPPTSPPASPSPASRTRAAPHAAATLPAAASPHPLGTLARRPPPRRRLRPAPPPP